MQSKLRQFVKHVFSDEKTRREFEKDPSKVVARFDLNEQERNAVLATNARVGLVTSNSTALDAAIKANDGWAGPPP